jgi:hypothetical protein
MENTMIKLMALQWVVLLDVRFSQTFFLSFHEKEWLDNCSDSFKPIFSRRYVDDSFVLFNSRDHIVPFLDYLNSNIPKLDLLLKLKMMIKLCLFLIFTDYLQERFHFLSYQIFHAELEKFKKLLLQNGYPKFFMDRCVKTFLDKMISPPLKVQTPTVSKLLISIVLYLIRGIMLFRSVNNYTHFFPRLILKYKYV